MLPPGIRMRHLTTFVEVARARSFVKAADALAVTQPAVSKTVRELEALLAVPLLDRSRRTVALTTFGEIFLRHAEASLVSLRRGVGALLDARSPQAPPLRIGALPTVSARLLPQVLRAFMAAGLGAVPRVVTGPNAYLLSQLRGGDLDIVIGRMGDAAEMADFAFEQLYSERIAFVVNPKHPLRQRKALDVSRISEFEALMPPPGSAIRPVVDRLVLALGLPRFPAVLETVSPAFGRAYVRGGDAIWLISEGVVEQDVADGTLATLPVDTAQTLGPVGVTMRADRPVDPASETLLAELRRAAARIRSRDPAVSRLP
ncbi:pca operon transcription factor PcaQ [Aureimonas sp. ME7]|uniref:pca operon transcription factor PcaQ n=1 Tax=Aureimonas sp. ME7 TaxID=2744252 RepID=UPI0015F44A49|nr:pca operon transcription factor PcaQ [Aureimonas sp. ME7]